MATPPSRDPIPNTILDKDPHQLAADTRRRVLEAALSLQSQEGRYDSGGTAYPQLRGTTPAQAVDRFLVLLQDRLPGWLRELHGLMDVAGKGDVSGNLLPVARAAIDYYAEVQAAALPAFVSPSVTVRFRQALRENELGPDTELRPLAAYLGAEQERGRVPTSVNPVAVARLLLAGCFRHAFYEMFVGPDVGPTRDEAAREIVTELRLSAV
ncbi:hypothetical protein J5X84_22090 [Streptosporangiaceae bacterium NEAU-GS5]|nr:hypothetical protein [Streptosporangiaceae bacterium NEAU-GS5]